MAYVHVGTHKTGTTAIQRLLAVNEERFGAAGIFLPRTGRLDPSLAAVHNVAFELSHNPEFDPHAGTFADLGCEIEAANPSTLCLSSEEFAALAVNRGGLLRLFAGLTSVFDFEPRIIVYLRPQADYIESLYAELVKHDRDVPFASFFESIVTEGEFENAILDYVRLLQPFAKQFGARRLILRSYQSVQENDGLLYDFARIIAPPDFAFDGLRIPERMNRRLTFDGVLARCCHRAHHIARDTPFEPLTLADVTRVVARFAPLNLRLRQEYGLSIPPVSPRRLQREIARTLTGDRIASERRELLSGVRAQESA